MQTSSFSQNTYPRRIVCGSDTCIAITEAQLVEINKSLNAYEHLQQVNGYLEKDVALLDSMNCYWEKASIQYEALLETERSKFSITETQLKRDLSNCKKKRIKQNFVVGVGGTLLGLLIGVLF